MDENLSSLMSFDEDDLELDLFADAFRPETTTVDFQTVDFMELMSPDGDADDYIPASLASFVAEAKATLRDTQLSLQAHFESPAPAETSMVEESPSQPQHLSMTEDDDDRRLKRHVLDRLSKLPPPGKLFESGHSSNDSDNDTTTTSEENDVHDYHMISPQGDATVPSPLPQQREAASVPTGDTISSRSTIVLDHTPTVPPAFSDPHRDPCETPPLSPRNKLNSHVLNSANAFEEQTSTLDAPSQHQSPQLSGVLQGITSPAELHLPSTPASTNNNASWDENPNSSPIDIPSQRTPLQTGVSQGFTSPAELQLPVTPPRSSPPHESALESPVSSFSITSDEGIDRNPLGPQQTPRPTGVSREFLSPPEVQLPPTPSPPRESMSEELMSNSCNFFRDEKQHLSPIHIPTPQKTPRSTGVPIGFLSPADVQLPPTPSPPRETMHQSLLSNSCNFSRDENQHTSPTPQYTPQSIAISPGKALSTTSTPQTTSQVPQSLPIENGGQNGNRTNGDSPSVGSSSLSISRQTILHKGVIPADSTIVTTTRKTQKASQLNQTELVTGMSTFSITPPSPKQDERATSKANEKYSSPTLQVVNTETADDNDFLPPPSTESDPTTLVRGYTHPSTLPPHHHKQGLDDDSFLPNQTSVMFETPPLQRPIPKAKTVMSKAAPRPSASSNQRKSMSTSGITRPRVVSSTSTMTAETAQSTLTPGSKVLKPSIVSRVTQGISGNKVHASTGAVGVVESMKSPDEGVLKARERIRQQRLKQLQSKRAEEDGVTEASKLSSRSSTRGTAISVEEGRARAQERIRQRQLQMKLHQEQVTSTPSNGTKVARVGISAKQPIEGSIKKQQQGNTIPQPRQIHAQARTVPKSPHLATKAILGQKMYSSSGRQSDSSMDENPITRAFGSPTHASNNVTKSLNATRSGRPPLTVPKAPRLSTLAKYGDKPPPTVREVEIKHATSHIPQPRSEPKPTIPVPFHFHQSKTPAPSSSKTKVPELSMAESMDLFMRKGLRDESAAASVKFDSKLTIPKSPTFSNRPQRSKPKSAVEIEEEVMEHYRTHPFRALPLKNMSENRGGERGVPKVDKRAITTPAPFNLRVDMRSTTGKPPMGSPDPVLADLEECKKKFHARPLPNLAYKPPVKTDFSTRSLTTPKPFNLATEKRALKSEGRLPTPDEIEMKKQFHALPLPTSTFAEPHHFARRLKSGIPSVIVTTKDTSPDLGPPILATSARPERRQASKEASWKHAEMLAQQKKRQAMQKQREKHLEEMAKASVHSPAVKSPMGSFHLLSEARHEAYQRQLAEQRMREEQENHQKSLFRAKPGMKRDSLIVISRSERPVTTPEPFHLQSLTRHELALQSMQQKRKEDEIERQRMSHVKAIPLPKSTYEYNPITPRSQKALVQPFSPEMQSKQRALERKEFDESVKLQRALESENKRAFEEHVAAEIDKEIQEKRRLPVKEGGMIPTAEPINAVFLISKGAGETRFDITRYMNSMTIVFHHADIF